MAVVDFARVEKEAAFLKKALKHFGLNFDLGDAIKAMAKRVRDHKHLETILSQEDPETRQQVYDSIRPHLRFTAHPLDHYISQAGEMAEREQLPVLGEDGKLYPFRPARDVSSAVKDAEEAIAREIASRRLTLTCAKCLREDEFYGVGKETNVDVILKARRAGWIYDYRTDPAAEICPKCPSSLRPEKTPNDLPQPVDL